MGVLSCTYNYGGRSTQISVDDVSSQESWIIVTDDRELHPVQAALLAQSVGPNKLPQIGTLHPYDKRADLKTISVSPKSGEPSVLIATGKYDRKFDQKKDDKETNPLNDQPVYFLERHQFQEVVQADLKGKPLVNAVGVPFNPPIVQDDSRPILVATRNMSSLAAIVALQQQFKDAVNLGTFYGAGPRQAKVMSIIASGLKEKNKVSFYEVSIRIAFKGEGETWDQRILNQGLTYKFYPKLLGKYITDSKTGKPKSIVQSAIDGTKITEPQNLNEIGELLGEFERNEDDTFKKVNGKKIPTKPVYLSFRTYPERDFSQLNI